MRRRRAKGVWFPTFGNECGTFDPHNNLNGVNGELDIDTSGDMAISCTPLTADWPEGEQAAPANRESLSDILGQEYLLQRVVGKLWIHQTVAGEPPLAESDSRCYVSAGLFAARADGTEPDQLIGTTAGSTSDICRDYSPAEQATMREPWIWRRSWILSVNGWDAGGSDGFPSNNVNYGSSSLDGPHVDSKSKRRIGSDDRLWLSVGACIWPPRSQDEGNEVVTKVWYYFDYRLFGQLRRSNKKGTF